MNGLGWIVAMGLFVWLVCVTSSIDGIDKSLKKLVELEGKE